MSRQQTKRRCWRVALLPVALLGALVACVSNDQVDPGRASAASSGLVVLLELTGLT